MPSDKNQTRKLRFCKFCKKRIVKEGTNSILLHRGSTCNCGGYNALRVTEVKEGSFRTARRVATGVGASAFLRKDSQKNPSNFIPIFSQRVVLPQNAEKLNFAPGAERGLPRRHSVLRTLTSTVSVKTFTTLVRSWDRSRISLEKPDEVS